ADRESRRPIDPQTTAFRAGSLSKIFTTVAVLQQVERGKLSLKDAIQPRLTELSMGDAGNGVTIHHLLTHTDGFEVGWCIDAAVTDGQVAPSLAEFLQSRLPGRILPPGRMYVYSDVGMALAGRLVEKIDGRAFERYTREEIFEPLGMSSSTFE